MNIVNINDNLINLDAVAVVENRGKGIRIRYIGGYQTVIDCLDYDTFVKWAKENLVSDYADGYKKGIEDATQDMRTTISETTDEVISRVADIVRKYFDYNGGNHREVFREIIGKVYKVRDEIC